MKLIPHYVHHQHRHNHRHDEKKAKKIMKKMAKIENKLGKYCTDGTSSDSSTDRSRSRSRGRSRGHSRTRRYDRPIRAPSTSSDTSESSSDRDRYRCRGRRSRSFGGHHHHHHNHHRHGGHRHWHCHGRYRSATPANAEEPDTVNQTQPEIQIDTPEIQQTLVDNWTTVLINGLSIDKRNAIINKYPLGNTSSLLTGPKLNKEMDHLPKPSIKKDNRKMGAQNKIGVGLTALGNAIARLNGNDELKTNKDVIDALETLNDAADIVLDAQRDVTEIRRDSLLPELPRSVRGIIDDCKPDEFLYGKDFESKLEELDGSNKKHWKSRRHHGRY